ncbi:MAG: DnaB-like helicase C-terminal domain-containing protein [Deltaproteobacteria bacterium]|nr:DnaB-like helicase C-terminal domain-containing protein [Deltaproteobacteria bacterium]
MPFHCAREIIEETLESAGEAGWLAEGKILTTEVVPKKPERPDKGASTISTGLKNLDRITGGLAPGELTVMAGFAGMGKTSLALNIAAHAAVDQGYPSAIFSLEAERGEIMARLLASRAKVALDNIYNSFITDEAGWLAGTDRKALDSATAGLYAAPLYIDDTPAHTAASIKAQLEAEKNALDIKLVIIDCLQLIQPSSPEVSGQLGGLTGQPAGLAGGLRAIAKELNVPIVATYQLPHVWQEKKVMPHPSFLIKEGFTEALDADMVIFIYRKSVCGTCKSPIEICKCWETHRAHVVAAKRGHASGAAEIVFISQFLRFEDPA